LELDGFDLGSDASIASGIADSDVTGVARLNGASTGIATNRGGVADSGAVLSGAVSGVSKVEGVGGSTTSTYFTRDLISTIVENQYEPGRRHTVLKVAAGVDAFIERVLHGPTDKALLRA
jgi:hypothetical protein